MFPHLGKMNLRPTVK